MYIKLFKFDIKNGLLKNKVLLSASLIIPIILCIDYIIKVKGITFGQEVTLSFADYYMYIFGGVKEGVVFGMKDYIPSPTTNFIMPIMWSIVFITLFYGTLNYPFNDMSGIGKQILIRTKGRISWWISKCIWNLICCLFFFSIILGVIWIFCLITGAEISGKINVQLLNSVYNTKIEEIDGNNILMPVYMFVLPIIVTSAISIMQMTISLFIKPIFSFLVTVVLLVFSAYVLSPCLIGNFLILIRFDYIVANGLNFYMGIFVSIFVIVCSIIIGVLKFRHYDIINKE
ncbi:hypothetical protein SAMN02745196_01142 [Clostridium collagenovorans DSM 3089]|uniref:ABC-2 family transporter protein n=1 Tax=Clostridium collagenovorans DSM 3089 TaxID=1121306 RepID=A0A1M5V6Y2_9CLOT|nr:hypothetical protein [Clostridium collagenovorans]SHH70975.1 hypothetical protein SAMN02745196_01142 [Clostridium collagenovorans DSM 3089]